LHISMACKSRNLFTPLPAKLNGDVRNVNANEALILTKQHGCYKFDVLKTVGYNFLPLFYT
jgi:hypothetical protein